jgi:hypothetical protein
VVFENSANQRRDRDFLISDWLDQILMEITICENETFLQNDQNLVILGKIIFESF